MNANSHIRWRVPKAVTLWLQEVSATVTLAVPLVLTVLSFMAMVTTDRIMMGRLGPEPLAGGTLGGHFYIFFEYFAIGVLSAVAPILSQDLGARRYRQVWNTFLQGFWVAIVISVPCMAIIWHTQFILVLLGQAPELASAGQSYVRFMVLGFLPGLWFVVLNRFLAAHIRPRATLVVSMLGIGANALANYALMFGHFGFPRMGLIGAGISTAVVTTLMFLVLLVFVLFDHRLRRYSLLGRIWNIDRVQIYEILRLGIPIAITNLSEISIFLAATLLMGLIGTNALAAHAIVLQCSAFVYMVPYGIAQAATVRVGRAIGDDNNQAAVRAGWIAVALGAVLAILPASAFWIFGDAIVSTFLGTLRPESSITVELGVSFLAIAAILHFADAIQITAMGALRGLKDTRTPMLISLSGYWGLGLTSAALFGVYLNIGGRAIWISLVVATILVGALLVRRFLLQSLQLVDETR